MSTYTHYTSREHPGKHLQEGCRDNKESEWCNSNEPTLNDFISRYKSRILGWFHIFGGASRLFNWLSAFFMFSCIVCEIPLISQWGCWSLSQQLLGVHYRYIRIYLHTHTHFRGFSQTNVDVFGLSAKLEKGESGEPGLRACSWLLGSVLKSA